MRRIVVGWVIGTSLSVAACGGGGGGGGGPAPTPPTPTSFTLGPTTQVTTITGTTPPNTLLATVLSDHDDDGIPDLVWMVSTTFMGTPIFDVGSAPGAGDGTFVGDYGGGGYESDVTPFLQNGDVLGVGKEGYVLAGENPTGWMYVTTIGFRIVGPSRSEVGGFGLATGTLAGLAVGDVDGDGIDDVVLLDSDARRVVEFHSQGETGLDSGIPTALPSGTGETPNAIAATDFGPEPSVPGAHEDLFVSLGTDGYVVLTSQGDGTFTAGPVVALGSGRSFSQVVTGDFDGDGFMDVAGVVEQSGLPHRLGTLFGHGDGTFDPLQTRNLPPAFGVATLTQFQAGDLNGDGRTDVAFLVPDEGTAAVYLTNGAGGFEPLSDALLQTASDTLTLHEIDADGDLDILLGNATTLEVFALFNDLL